MFSPSLEHILINIIQGDFFNCPPNPPKKKKENRKKESKVWKTLCESTLMKILLDTPVCIANVLCSKYCQPSFYMLQILLISIYKLQILL